MKKKINKIIGIFLVFISMILVTNSIYAKDIKYHATSSNQDVVFQTFIGADPGNAVNYGRWTYLDSYELYKKYSDDLVPDKHVHSYTFLIHNKPYTKYKSTPDNPHSNAKTFGYADKPENITKYATLVSENTNVNSIEFRRLTNARMYKKSPSGKSIYFGRNIIKSNMVEEIVKNADKYKVTDKSLQEEDNYCFYLSEPMDAILGYADLYQKRKFLEYNIDSGKYYMLNDSKPIGFISAYAACENVDFSSSRL